VIKDPRVQNTSGWSAMGVFAGIRGLDQKVAVQQLSRREAGGRNILRAQLEGPPLDQENH